MHLSTIGGDDDFKANLKNMTKAGDDVEKRAAFRLPLKAGPHTITVAFLERSAALNPLRLQPFIRSSNDTLDTIGHPHLDTFTLTGPFNPTGPGDTPSRRRIFICKPPGDAAKAEEDACARRIITTFARRAYRGLATPTDVDRLLEFYQSGRKTRDVRARHPECARSDDRQPEVHLPRRARSGGGGARRRCIGSPTSSSRRGCRSSSGAAFPTTSCCRRRGWARCTRRRC